MTLLRFGPVIGFRRGLLAAAVACFAFPAPVVADHDGDLVEVNVGDALNIPAWRNLGALIDRDSAEIEVCRQGGSCSRPDVMKFVAFLTGVADQSPDSQLEAVNDYFNRLPYTTDISTFGIEDVWQSPLSFIAGSGDCEDYAIAKYAALKLLGFAEQDLRVVVLLDESRGMHHAVLEVRKGDRSLVLDNLSADVESVMNDAYQPIYALNRVDGWIYMPASDDQQPESAKPAQTAPASGHDTFLVDLF